MAAIKMKLFLMALEREIWGQKICALIFFSIFTISISLVSYFLYPFFLSPYVYHMYHYIYDIHEYLITLANIYWNLPCAVLFHLHSNEPMIQVITINIHVFQARTLMNIAAMNLPLVHALINGRTSIWNRSVWDQNLSLQHLSTIDSEAHNSKGNNV